MTDKKRVLLTGASGLIGQALFKTLKEKGYDVYRLVRHSSKREEKSLVWDLSDIPENLAPFEGFYAVIHLCGENVTGFWSEEKKERLYASRVHTTQRLSHLLSQLKQPPKVFMCASAIGFYGNRGKEVLDEESTPGKNFLSQLCQDWEMATEEAKNKGLRVVSLRLGLVLSRKGGVFKKMYWPFFFGLGGYLGDGEQYMSFITIDDLIRVFLFLLEKESIWGAVNLCTPYPVTNKEFTRSLGQAMHRPTPFPISERVLRYLFGQMADELLLSSTRAIPKKLLKAHFVFKYPTLKSAFDHLLK